MKVKKQGFINLSNLNKNIKLWRSSKTLKKTKKTEYTEYRKKTRSEDTPFSQPILTF